MALGSKKPEVHITPSALDTIVATRLTLGKYTKQSDYHAKGIVWISFEPCSSGQNCGLQGLQFSACLLSQRFQLKVQGTL